jgi:predicted AAA+ superfamily ATPase
MEQELIELNNEAKEEGNKYTKKRFIYPKISAGLTEREHTALVGPRGAGKTILLKQLLADNENAFYVSLDTTRLESGLFKLAKELSDSGIKLLLLDEIHGYPGYDVELKKIYDFLGIKVVLTSSSALILHELAADLSRRMRIMKIRPFSFREFLFFQKDERLEPLRFELIFDENASREYYGRAIHVEPSFIEYLQGRNYPLTLGGHDFLPLFRSMLETVINRDLIRTGRIVHDETLHLARLAAFLGKSHPEDMSYTSIAKNIGISRYKAEKYVDLLEKAFILHRVPPEGHGVMKEPKVLMALPYRLLYRPYDECVGALREDFFVDSAVQLGFDLRYLKTNRGEKTPDYAVDDVVFEIGGPGKGHSQFKGFKMKRKVILTQPGILDSVRRPLFFMGLLGEDS